MATVSLHCSNCYLDSVLARSGGSKKPANGGSRDRGVTPVQLPEKTRDSKVLILGGTGRIGGSTARALSKLCPSLRLLIAGRNRDKGYSLASELGENSEFVEVNIDNTDALSAAMEDADLVIHAAGPFQQAKNCNVLEVAIGTKTSYIDVCDDADYAWRAKSFHEKAVSSGIPAITTCGIYPGVSNVMAAELVRAAKTNGSNEPEKLRIWWCWPYNFGN